MDLRKIQETEERYYANTFSRLPVAITRGEGMYVYDVEDRRYLDMFAGIAVDSLGHSHPEVVSTIRKQSGLLMHTSNWYYTLPQLRLAQLLVKLTGLEKAFITNDGTEAVETAIKLARKATGKKEIIAMKNAFHGRTLGALSLTWGEKYRKPFMPLLPGIKFAEYNDVDALREKITGETAAVIVEPIQGEAGVIIPDDGYLEEVREITVEKNILLILDEVQTGFGRTGEMFAFQHSGIKPDIICLAKGMGGGFPIGATVFDCGDFKPGEHGGTFIGNPLACEVANTVINVIVRERLAENASRMGDYLLNELKKRGMGARGRGLMVGVEVEDGKRTVLDLIEKGVLTIYSGNTLRILPPLIIERKHVDEFLTAFDSLKH
ncbi:MAG: aspartate aminotransferase family protein [Candidatus Altiarchaeota archaeon]|nr:aspartate aminotransferase family protein [Candidatus Altiarchaeota archaeon]